MVHHYGVSLEFKAHENDATQDAEAHDFMRKLKRQYETQLSLRCRGVLKEKLLFCENRSVAAVYAELSSTMQAVSAHLRIPQLQLTIAVPVFRFSNGQFLGTESRTWTPKQLSSMFSTKNC